MLKPSTDGLDWTDLMSLDDLHGQNWHHLVHGGHGHEWNVINGGPGDDQLIGTSADDLVTGRAGADILVGWGGNDILLGGGGDDTIFETGGNDIVSGGGGTDTYVLSAGDQGIVDLSTGLATTAYGQDYLTGIVNVVGSYFDDVIIGDNHDNLILGNSAFDTLTGGGGRDTFLMSDILDPVDTITDFQTGVDTLAFRQGFIDQFNPPPPYDHEPLPLGRLTDDLFSYNVEKAGAFLVFDESSGTLYADFNPDFVGDASHLFPLVEPVGFVWTGSGGI